jgi:5-methylcytosine-specific restriction protein B
MEAKHIEAALDEIDRLSIPIQRRSTRHCLVARGKHYPPKVVLGLAHKYAEGREWLPNEHSGGDNTNGPLMALGYVIRRCGCKNIGLFNSN